MAPDHDPGSDNNQVDRDVSLPRLGAHPSPGRLGSEATYRQPGTCSTFEGGRITMLAPALMADGYSRLAIRRESESRAWLDVRDPR